jgi:hypothetical protein
MDAGAGALWLGVWAAGDDDIFLVGTDRNTTPNGAVAHWNGTRFEKVGITPAMLTAVHGLNARDIWAVDNDGGIYHYGP